MIIVHNVGSLKHFLEIDIFFFDYLVLFCNDRTIEQNKPLGELGSISINELIDKGLLNT